MVPHSGAGDNDSPFARHQEEVKAFYAACTSIFIWIVTVGGVVFIAATSVHENPFGWGTGSLFDPATGVGMAFGVWFLMVPVLYWAGALSARMVPLLLLVGLAGFGVTTFSELGCRGGLNHTILPYVVPIGSCVFFGSRVGVLSIVVSFGYSASLCLRPETPEMLQRFVEDPVKAQFARYIATLGSILIMFLASWRISMSQQQEQERVQMHYLREKARVEIQAKTDVIAAMAHELKTPLSVILSATDVFEEPRLTVKKMRKWLPALREGAVSLSGVIENVLYTSRLEFGETGHIMAPFTFSGIMSRIERMFSHICSSKGVGLSFSLMDGLADAYFGDETSLTQVLVNVVGNAVKYTSSGNICVTVARTDLRAESCEHYVCITVQDTGPGIPENEMQSIFDKFVRGMAFDGNRAGGTGIGLYVVDQLVRRMKGHVWAESLIGEGSTFFLELPLRTAPDEAVVEEFVGSSSAPRDHVRVLLVEDNKSLQMLLMHHLRQAGHAVVLAQNGQEAVNTFFSTPDDFDMILMDMLMPVMDGLRATQRIRADPAGATIPIVAMTARTLAAEVNECFEAGATAYLPKPVKKEALLACVASLGKSAVNHYGHSSL